MKILHISDLHLGKRVHGFSMEEEQAHMLKQVLAIISDHQVEMLLISGDIYDRSVPSESATHMLDSFLEQLVEQNIVVCMISGNHDSAMRLQYGSSFFERSQIYISSVYDGNIEQVHYHNVDLFLIPFIKPVMVRPFFPDREIVTYEDAMKAVLSTITFDPKTFHIALVHQFISGSKTCDSEQKNIGGLDEIPASLFEEFDYVALGHLHSYQRVAENMVYCGTLLKYSVDEIKQEKRAVLLTIDDTIHVETIPFSPLHDLVEIKGTYMELTERSFYKDLDREDYYSIVLLDEYDVVNAQAKLQVIYPKILKLSYENRKRYEKHSDEWIGSIEVIDPMTMINSFYKEQNGQDLSSFQKQWILDHWEDEQ